MYKSITKNDTKEEPFVSVLTPVYNGEEFLRECIESVLNQNYDNWEYVIVNNCSTDSSFDIANEYAAIDKRIRIHNNENFLSQMHSLNHSFRQIAPESKYCKVIHADDWMFPECLSRMVNHAEKYPEVGIINSYYLDDDTVRPQGLPYPSHVIDGRKLGREYFLNHHTYFGAPSNILIRTELLTGRDQIYDPDNIHSDHGLCLDILKNYEFGFVHQVLTFSRRHEDSHTSQVADKYDTYGLGRLKNLLNHGSSFLTSEEMDFKKSSILKSIYKMIARKMLFSRSKEVINYHYKSLKDIGLEPSRRELIKYVVKEMLSVRKYMLKLKEKFF